MVAGKKHLNSTFFLLHYICLRDICLCRCFWSARMPSDRVPSGRPGQAVYRIEQSWSGGLHKLLPACAQVGSYSYMLAFASEGFENVLTWTRCFGSKKLEKECLVSVVADLRQASLPTVRLITETLLLLEVLGIEHAFLLLICSRFSSFCGNFLPVLTRLKFVCDSRWSEKCEMYSREGSLWRSVHFDVWMERVNRETSPFINSKAFFLKRYKTLGLKGFPLYFGFHFLVFRHQVASKWWREFLASCKSYLPPSFFFPLPRISSLIIFNFLCEWGKLFQRQ